MGKKKTNPDSFGVMRVLVEIDVHRLSDGDPTDFNASELVDQINRIVLGGYDFFVSKVRLVDVTGL